MEGRREGVGCRKHEAALCWVEKGWAVESKDSVTRETEWACRTVGGQAGCVGRWSGCLSLSMWLSNATDGQGAMRKVMQLCTRHMCDM